MLIPTTNPNKKYYINSGILLLFVVTVLGITGYAVQSSVKAEEKEKQVCKNFNTQEEAQRIYDKYINDRNYSIYVKRLDANHNKKACEHLPHENN